MKIGTASYDKAFSECNFFKQQGLLSGVISMVNLNAGKSHSSKAGDNICHINDGGLGKDAGVGKNREAPCFKDQLNGLFG